MISIFAACLFAIPLASADEGDSEKVKEKRAKAEELRKRIATDQQDYLKIKNGPCLCGAPSHSDCKTKGGCEPAEELKMKGFRDDAVAASEELQPISTFLDFYDRTGKEIRERLSQEAHLLALRDRLNRVIRKNAERQDWREDLDDWVKESQKAQSEALSASLNVLAGPLGGIGKEIEKHKATQERLMQALERTRPLLSKASEAVRAARGPAVGRAVNEWSRLNQIEMALEKMLKGPETAQACWEHVKLLTEGTEILVKGSQAWDEVKDAHARQKLLGALGAVNEVLLETVAGYYADKNIEMLAETSAKSAQVLQGARWALDYGLASWRFYESCKFVNSIVGQVEEDLKIVGRLHEKVKLAQEEVLDIRRECAILKESRAKDTPDMLRALRESRKMAKERMAKYHAP